MMKNNDKKGDPTVRWTKAKYTSNSILE